MALKLTIDDLVEVPGNLRDDYKLGDDGKFHLVLDGDLPESAKLAEFRQTNISLMKERDALKAQAAELLAKPADTAKLEADLAAERTAHAATQLKGIVSAEFLYNGGRGSAVDFVVGEAAKVFAIENGTVTSKEFSPTDPSKPLSVKEWIEHQMKEKDYIFQPSRGGGAPAHKRSGVAFGSRPNQTVLKNPTPQQLGANAKAIASGDVKIEIS